MKDFSKIGLSVVMSVLWIGCGADSPSDPKDTSPDPMSCQIFRPAAAAALSGDVEVVVDVGGPVARVELLVDDQVVSEKDVAESALKVALVWKSATAADGMKSLKARAVDTTGATKDSDPVRVLVDNTPPQVSFGQDLQRFQVVSGQMPIPLVIEESNLVSVRLVAGETDLLNTDVAVQRYDWDTTSLDDGIHYLTLQVIDAADQRALIQNHPVVVLNQGEEVKGQYLPAPQVVVPENYQQVEYHTRISVPAAANVERIISWITWDSDVEWKIEYAIGQGMCPHRGIKYIEEVVTGNSGEIALDLRRGDLSADIVERFPVDQRELATFPINADPATFGTFFGHVAPLDPADHINQTLPIDVHFALIYAE